MIVTMVAVGVMEMAVNEVVDVIAVRDRLVTTIGTVRMICVMLGHMVRRARVGVLLGHGDHVLIDVVLMRVMQVPVVEVVHMPVVLDRGVAAVLAVLVVMVVCGVGGMVVAHAKSPDPAWLLESSLPTVGLEAASLQSRRERSPLWTCGNCSLARGLPATDRRAYVSRM